MLTCLNYPPGVTTAVAINALYGHVNLAVYHEHPASVLKHDVQIIN